MTQEGTKVGISNSGCLLGVWDDISSKAGLTDQIIRNITDFAGGCGAVMALFNQKERGGCCFRLECLQKVVGENYGSRRVTKELQVYRSTGVAVIKFSKNKELAKKFLNLVVSESGIRIYGEWLVSHNSVNARARSHMGMMR